MKGNGSHVPELRVIGVPLHAMAGILESVLKIIGQGPGTNLLIHENFHLSINANGTLTALIDNSSFHKGNSAQVNVVDVLCKKRKPNLQCQS